MIRDLLKFKGEWRDYQQRIINRYDKVMEDGLLHVVAAPGSGKTTLGIEILAMINKPTLILVPTLTIKEQWFQRIEKAFLKEGFFIDDIVSRDLKDAKVITVATYQAIFCSINQINEETDDEVYDFKDFDLFSSIKKQGIETIVLDECHHLRNEWWKSLETLKETLNPNYLISLTATPPYDSDYNLWKRYINLCGEIDEEIIVPELVKEDNLCPHQDYIYFSFPTRSEEKKIKEIKKSIDEYIDVLMNDKDLENYCLNHSLLKSNDLEILLDNPAHLSSLLIYQHAKGYKVSRKYKNILGYKKMIGMSAKWMEILLQNFIDDETISDESTLKLKDNIIHDLKSKNLFIKKKVILDVNTIVKKDLVRSISKCESIKTITFHEYSVLKEKTRLLILCDYIKKEMEQAINKLDEEVDDLAVVPLFESLRRECLNKNIDIPLGVLCGSLAIIPNKAKDRLTQIVQNDNISFKQIGELNDLSYVKVEAGSNRQFLTKALTQLFEEGYIQALIGTKSLLGEGWDSPCVNTLILASYVGSFMLSNQMRGRAIRTYAKDENKTSNIWHLACVSSLDMNTPLDGSTNEDIDLLTRRMNNFIGLHYTQDTIENGMMRFTNIKNPLTKTNIKKANKESLKISKDRLSLKDRWYKALTISEKMEVVEESLVDKKNIPVFIISDLMAALFIQIVFIVGYNGLKVNLSILNSASDVINLVLVFVVISTFIILIIRLIEYASPLNRLKTTADALLKCLIELNLVSTSGCKVIHLKEELSYAVYLSGGSYSDKALFATCIKEMYSPIDNQRYVIHSNSLFKKSKSFLAVPEILAKRKDDATLLAKLMSKKLGKLEAIYTRSEKGRQILLMARAHSLANKNERVLTRKKYKGAFE